MFDVFRLSCAGGRPWTWKRAGGNTVLQCCRMQNSPRIFDYRLLLFHVSLSLRHTSFFCLLVARLGEDDLQLPCDFICGFWFLVAVELHWRMVDGRCLMFHVSDSERRAASGKRQPSNNQTSNNVCTSRFQGARCWVMGWITGYWIKWFCFVFLYIYYYII